MGKKAFNNQVIKSGYVIAVYDKTISSKLTDPCRYFSNEGTWDLFKNARIYPNEATLARGIIEADKSVEFFEHDGPYPIYWQTTIDSVDDETYEQQLLQRKREIAMAKLDDDDMVVLGLMGGPEK